MKRQTQTKLFLALILGFSALSLAPAAAEPAIPLWKQGRVHYVSLQALSEFYSLKHETPSPGKEILFLKGQPLAFSAGSKLATLNSSTLFSLNRAALPKDHRLCLSVGSAVTLLPLLKASLTPKPVLRVPCAIQNILIDPGHGGKDPGAFKNGLVEKKLNLKIAKLVFENLSRAGFHVKMTRYKDSALKKNERVLMADQMEADLLLSIHANYSKYAYVKGPEFFILRDLSQHRDLAATQAALPDAPAFYQYLDKNYQAITHKLCRSMEKHLTQLEGVKSRGIKNAGFYLLRNSHCPAVIVEMGFLSNPDEAAKLKDTAHLEALANELTDGIVEYCHAHQLEET